MEVVINVTLTTAPRRHRRCSGGSPQRSSRRCLPRTPRAARRSRRTRIRSRRWSDAGVYTLVAGGDFEGDLSGLDADRRRARGRGQRAVPGRRRGRRRRSAPGDSVTTAPICIDDTYPWFRFFADNRRAAQGQAEDRGPLHRPQGQGAVQERGRLHDRPTRAGSRATRSASTSTGDHAGDTVPVQFRFTAQPNSSFELDDVYVDPMARG